MAAIAVAAIALDRPVKWAEDRLENFLAAYQGRGMEAEVELALDADGTMLAVRARLWADLGAYLVTSTAVPAHTTAMLMCGVYRIPAAQVEMVGARTDKVPTGPYRGAGRPEAAYFVERAVDDAARATGIDPVELRRRNLVREFPYRTPLGWTYDSGDYERCLDLALGLVAPPAAAGADRVSGSGVAMYVERAGGQWEAAEATVEPSGRVVIRSSSSPHGQGHETTFAAIAADQLGVPMDDIVLQFGDSAVVPRGVGTFASRSTAMAGSAIVRALEKIVERARPLAAHLLGVDAEQVAWGDGRFTAPGAAAVTLRDVARLAYRAQDLPPGVELGLHAAARFRSPLVFGSGAYAASVEIERRTGILRVVSLAGVDDGGTVINPLLGHGQVVGGIAQGLGECLVEEAVHDETGQLRTRVVRRLQPASPPRTCRRSRSASSRRRRRTTRWARRGWGRAARSARSPRSRTPWPTRSAAGTWIRRTRPRSCGGRYRRTRHEAAQRVRRRRPGAQHVGAAARRAAGRERAARGRDRARRRRRGVPRDDEDQARPGDHGVHGQRPHGRRRRGRPRRRLPGRGTGGCAGRAARPRRSPRA